MARRRHRVHPFVGLFSHFGWKANLILAIVSFLVLHHFASYNVLTASGAERYAASSEEAARAIHNTALSQSGNVIAETLSKLIATQYLSIGALISQFVIPGTFLLAAVFAFFQNQSDTEAVAERKTQWVHVGLLLGLVFLMFYWSVKPAMRGSIPLPELISGVSEHPHYTQSNVLVKQETRGVIYLHPDLIAEFSKPDRVGVLKGVMTHCSKGEQQTRVIVGVLQDGNSWANKVGVQNPLGSPHSVLQIASRLEHGGAITSKWHVTDHSPVPSDLWSSHFYLGAIPTSELPPLQTNAALIGQALPMLQRSCPSSDLSMQLIGARYQQLEAHALGLLGSAPEAVRHNAGQVYYFGNRHQDAAQGYQLLLASLSDLGPPSTLQFISVDLHPFELQEWRSGPYVVGAALASTEDGWTVSIQGPLRMDGF